MALVPPLDDTNWISSRSLASQSSHSLGDDVATIAWWDVSMPLCDGKTDEQQLRLMPPLWWWAIINTYSERRNFFYASQKDQFCARPLVGRPFVKRFALSYRTVVCLPCPVLSCLSICGVGVLWPNSWMDQHATWYGDRHRLWPHSVRWGPSLPKGAQQLLTFRPMSIVTKRVVRIRLNWTELVHSCDLRSSSYDVNVFNILADLVRDGSSQSVQSRSMWCQPLP